jgi:hypothetical protein
MSTTSGPPPSSGCQETLLSPQDQHPSWGLQFSVAKKPFYSIKGARFIQDTQNVAPYSAVMVQRRRQELEVARRHAVC